MPWPEAALLLAAFFLLALLYSTVGHAGASGYLAAMALFGFAPAGMRPTALGLNLLVALITTFRFHRAGFFAWRAFWPFALASVPLAALGGALSLPDAAYRRVVGAVLVLSALRLAWTAARAAAEEDGPERRAPLPAALGSGAAIGLLSGLTGVGGGIFLSPLLLLCGWATTRQTAAVSAAFILVNSAAGLAGCLWNQGPAAVPAALPAWAAAVVAGGAIGSWLGSRRLGSRTLRLLLAAVLTLAGVKMMWVD